MTVNCAICSREEAEARRAAAPSRPARTPKPAAARPSRSASHVRIRQAATAADDGYRNELVPGMKSSADAERLVAALAASVQRLEQLAADPPGPYAAIAGEPDPDEAVWRAFVLVHRDAAAAQPAASWAAGAQDDDDRTITALRAWAERQGGLAAGFGGQDTWTPERRFAHVFERLSLPGFGRDPRYELLVVLGATGVAELRADALHPVGDEPVTVAAKRVFNSGDTMLLERRARALVEAVAVPMDALDRALAEWGAAPRGSRPDDVPATDAALRALDVLDLG